MKLEILDCWCGRKVSVLPASGGTRSEATMYDVACPECGLLVHDTIPSNCSGRKADAIREWNKMRKTEKQPKPWQV